MRMILAGAAILAATGGVSAQSERLPTQEARLLCQAMDQTGLGSSPCEYSGWNSTITITADMISSEARQLCQQLSVYTANEGMGLSGWTLHIKSPYSGDNSIAFCPLS